ncbi:hypothetical protein AGMMS50293_22320 [Spirochaetia bacterium]|nr:hypothetical protein AGMMS50293_22320 [Spirochaetia bacterium]
MKVNMTGKIIFVVFLAGFLGFSPLYGADVRNTHIDINLIIDGSAALEGVMSEVTAWISGSLVDQLLLPGDRITIWSAGGTAKVIYSETLQNDAARETVKKALQSLSASGSAADFSGALREAAARRPIGDISYTLLVSASSAALSPTLLGPQSNLMRFSRIEEFRGWRALVIGLNLDSKVKRAAADYFRS